MAKIEIKAEKREIVGKKSKKIREQGLVPAVIYGKKFTATPIAVEFKDFEKKVLKSEAGHNLIFSLIVSDGGKGKNVPVITQELQYDPLTNELLHVDFMNIAMDEAIKTRVPVILNGLPIGVKEDGGILIHGIREIEIKSLPGDIPDKFELDVSALKVGDSLHVSDLKVSSKVEIMISKTEMLANVAAPTKEEEVAAPIPTPLDAAGAEEGAAAVAEEQVKDKAAPGAAPAKAAPAKPAQPAAK